MKSTLISILVLTFSLNTFALSKSIKNTCQKDLKIAERKLWIAENLLADKKMEEQNFLEIAEDASFNSTWSVSLLSVSGIILSGGTLAASSSQAPVFATIVERWVANSTIKALVVAMGPSGVSILGSLSYYATIQQQMNQENEAHDNQNEILRSLAIDKKFDEAQSVARKLRDSIDTNYSQYTDFLGLRDRLTTAKFYQVAKLSREIEEERVRYFKALLSGIEDKCK